MTTKPREESSRGLDAQHQRQFATNNERLRTPSVVILVRGAPGAAMDNDDVSASSSASASATAAKDAPSKSSDKQLLSARKKSAKSLKSKDASKKIEALKYCLEDELFVQEPDVLPLVIGFLSKVKVQIAYSRPTDLVVSEC